MVKIGRGGARIDSVHRGAGTCLMIMCCYLC